MIKAEEISEIIKRQLQGYEAEVDLKDLESNRIKGSTIPLYDKRKDVDEHPVEVVRVS